MSVLSLLYQGRGAELERTAQLFDMGDAVGIGLGEEEGGGGGGGGGNGVALDGRLPSRKELGQLAQLCFTKAAEVRWRWNFFVLVFCFRVA